MDTEAKGQIISYAYRRQGDKLFLASGNVMKRENNSWCATKVSNQEIRERAGLDLWNRKLGHNSKYTLLQMEKVL